jgi:hypothetical protein
VLRGACSMSLVSEWPVLKTMPRRSVNREIASTSSRLAAAITSVEIPYKKTLIKTVLSGLC